MSRLYLSVFGFITALLLVFPSTAYADTYELIGLPSAKGDQVIGFASQGVVVISQNMLGGFLTVDLYTGLINTWTTEPTLESAQGMCPDIPDGFNNSNGTGSYACNNGYLGFATRYNTNGATDGMYVGTISDLTYLCESSFDGGAMDLLGNFAWTDGLVDKNYAAINLTSLAPEPRSLLLVATGMFAAAALLHLRLGRR